MPDTQSLSRRDIFIGTSLLAAAGLAAESRVQKPSAGILASIVPFSIFNDYFLTVIKSVPGGVLGNLVTEQLEEIYHSIRLFLVGGATADSGQDNAGDGDYNSIVKIATERGLDPGMILDATMQMGKGQAGVNTMLALLHKNVPFALQQNDLLNGRYPIHGFQFHVNNPTRTNIGGSVTFSVTDDLTGGVEDFSIKKEGLSFPAQSERQIPFFITKNFPNPGSKTLKAIDVPNNILVSDVIIYVLPLSAQ